MSVSLSPEKVARRVSQIREVFAHLSTSLSSGALEPLPVLLTAAEYGGQGHPAKTHRGRNA